MFLKEVNKLEPKKYGHFIKKQPLLLSVHPSGEFFAFVSRQNQVIVHNCKNVRSTIYLKSEQPLFFITFTRHYLIVITEQSRQISIYSLKTEKLKKRLTGHRSQVLKVGYCPQRGIMASISLDNCILWDESTLASGKSMKCSTTEYWDCCFSFNGDRFFTSFADGNIFSWNLDNFQSQRVALKPVPHRLACNSNQFLIAYTTNNVLVSVYAREVFCFQQLECFWDGEVKQIDFVNNYVAVRTSVGLYLGEIFLREKVVVEGVRKMEGEIQKFCTGGYGSQIILVNKSLTTIRVMEVFREGQSKQVPLTNYLLNEASNCAGGFSNSNGCILGNLYEGCGTYNYGSQSQKLENLNGGMYRSAPFDFSQEKLSLFIRKNHIFPDKYRPTAYKFLLSLPISRANYLELERKSRHECTELILAKYPLENQNLSQSMTNIISLLANYCPIFAQSDLTAPIVFPFVCLFGQDEFFCFQLLVRLFNHWLGFLFEEFPLANTKFLHSLWEIMEKEDPTLLRHFKHANISVTKLLWHPLSNLFTTILAREQFLAVVDALFANSQQPQLIAFMALGLVSYHRERLLTLKNDQDLQSFLDNEQTVSTGQFLKKAYKLKDKYNNQLSYSFIPIQEHIHNYNMKPSYPEHSLKLHEGRRKLEQQQYHKAMEQQRYRDELGKQMEFMMIKMKKESERARIEAQSIAMHQDSSEKTQMKWPDPKRGQRIQRIRKLMRDLEGWIGEEGEKEQKLKQLMPKLQKYGENSSQKELQQVQQRLMSKLTELQPHRFRQPLKTNPITLHKQQPNHQHIKAAKNARITNQLWDLDQKLLSNQEQMWENQLLKAIK